jgi:solute carrier family 26 protein
LNRFPLPKTPSLWIYNDVLLSSIIIASISFAINFSLADGFSKRHKYKIYPSQELFAYGVCNLFASFFPSFPSGASLPRSTLQDNAGAKTQVNSI